MPSPPNPPSTPHPPVIRQGDVCTHLADLHKHHRFDVIIADPPYNIGKDFGNDSDSRELTAYIDWTKHWLDLCYQLLTPTGLIYVYGYAEILAHIAVHYPLHQQRWLTWHYTNKTTPASRFWQRSQETILCLWRAPRRPALEIDQIREPYTDHYLKCADKPRKDTPCRFNGNKARATTYRAHPRGALPRDVLKIPALAGGAGLKERWFLCHDCGNKVFPPSALKDHRGHKIMKHPTQKPMQLTQKLIRSRINGSGGRVLIPFAGSGSECVVAQSLNIPFVAIELNPVYVNFANQWLAQMRAHNV
ncbi:MAG: site-specific DNA-methyltransferase [Alphaproteobacteria bacterium GM202ARS2]|nr:site-specific DNA-methyltransferase [Alphaproteobacteria bacterium GM202ARS2]